MIAESPPQAPISAGWTLGMILVAGVAALAIGRSSTSAFAALAVVTLAGTAYAAYHWPRATLVGVAITTLLDPAVAVRLLPTSLALGPIGISEPLLLVVGVVALTRVSRAGLVEAIRDPTAVLMAAFVGVAVVSAVVNGVPPMVAILGIVMTVDAIAIYVVWRALQPPPWVASRAIAAIVAAGLVVALFGIAQVVLAPDLIGFVRVASLPGDVGQITSFVGNPNLLAPILGFLLPFPIYGALRLDGRNRRASAIAIAIVLLVGLLLTESRGAWIAAGAGIAMGTALLDVRALLVVAVLTLVAAATVAVMPVHLVGTDLVVEAPANGVSPSASPTPNPTPTPEPETPPPPDPHGGMTSEEIRLQFLRDGIRIVGQHPIVGVGPGRYGGAVATILPSTVYEDYGITLGRFRTIHNYWLHVAGEVGVVGVSLALTAIIALVIRFRRAARGADGPEFVVLAGAATSALVVIFNSATEMVLEGNIPAVLVWLILGIGAALAPDPRLGLLPSRAGGDG